MVVGWYHSHPGFGCWLSGVDINTQQVTSCLYPELLYVVCLHNFSRDLNQKGEQQCYIMQSIVA